MEGTPDNRIELSNANTGIFIFEEYLAVDDPSNLEPESSNSFPFCFHNNQGPFGDDDPCSKSNVVLKYVNFKNNYFHYYSNNAVYFGSSITNCNFTCSPAKMLAPFNPQIIDGKNVMFQTEACIVGFMHHRRQVGGFFETNNLGAFSNGGVQFSNNYFSDAFYGILMPGAPNFVQPNTYNNIDICAVRYFYYAYDGADKYNIENQTITLRPQIDTKLEYQKYNLDKVWNEINGFQGNALYYLGSSNIARHGLSTGYPAIQNTNINPDLQFGIFVNNDYDSKDYELNNTSWRASCDYVTPRYFSALSNYELPISIKNNNIKLTIPNYLYSVNPSHLAYGVYGSQTKVISNNYFEGLSHGIYIHQDISRYEGITQNQFINCKTGINIKSQLTFPSMAIGLIIGSPQALKLECNLFSNYNSTSVQQVGINLASGHLIGQIGDLPATSGGVLTGKLAGNVFPTTTTDRSIPPGGGVDVNDDWYSPSNWTSIVNNNSIGTVNYFRYKNEFIGTVSPITQVDISRAEFFGVTTKAFTDANNPAPSGSGYEKICDNTAVENFVNFPTPFIQNDNSNPIGKTGTIKTSIQGDGVNIISLDDQLISSIKLMDVLGRIVYSKNGLKIKSFQLPFEGLSNGTYLLQVQNGSGEIFSSKLIR